MIIPTPSSKKELEIIEQIRRIIKIKKEIKVNFDIHKNTKDCKN